MDSLLDQFLKDEITQEQFDEGVTKLSAEDKQKFDERLATPEVQKQIQDKAKEALDKLKGLRAAGKKVGDEGNPNLAASLRKENVAKASKRFFEKFKVPPEQQADYLKKLDASHGDTVSEDLLYSGLSSAYAAQHSDELLNDREQLEQMKANGEKFNADMAGAPGGGDGSGDGGKPRNPKVVEWMKEAAAKGNPFASYEAAEKALQGTKRIIA